MSRLEGDLTQWTVPALLARADELARAETLDLSAIGRADSAGVAFLLELRRRRDAPLRLAGTPPQLTRLIDFFAVAPLLETGATRA